MNIVDENTCNSVTRHKCQMGHRNSIVEMTHLTYVNVLAC